MGLVVRDPRVIMPTKRNSTELSMTEESVSHPEDISCPSESAQWRLQDSPLWSSGVRSSVSMSRQQDRDINTARGAALVPGTPLDLGDREGRVPVMLVEQAGDEDGCGQGGM